MNAIEQQLLERYGPLLTLEQLAEVFHRSPKGALFFALPPWRVFRCNQQGSGQDRPTPLL